MRHFHAEFVHKGGWAFAVTLVNGMGFDSSTKYGYTKRAKNLIGYAGPARDTIRL
jgi:hypothetical protein